MQNTTTQAQTSRACSRWFGLAQSISETPKIARKLGRNRRQERGGLWFPWWNAYRSKKRQRVPRQALRVPSVSPCCGVGIPRKRAYRFDLARRVADADKAIKTAARWRVFRQEEFACLSIDVAASRRRSKAVGDRSIALHIRRPKHPAANAATSRIKPAAAVDSCTMGKSPNVFGFDL